MELTRRNVLSLLGTAPLLSVPGLALATGKRGTRLHFLTDIHLPASQDINERARIAFKKANDCDILLFGGDNLMAIDNQHEDVIQAQCLNWQQFSAHHIKRPFRTVLGNHDIEKMDSEKDRMAGKTRASQLFKMKNRYWTEKVDGWRIIGLDTVQHAKFGYVGHIDREQRQWLRDTLFADLHTPTVVVGHVPLLSVTPMADRTLKCHTNSMPISFCTQVGNSRDVIEIFREAGNVKLCLSGHTHMIDRCEFAGTTYVCGGAVCGSWWRGPHQGFPPSFTQIDLLSAGQFNLKTVHCG